MSGSIDVVILTGRDPAATLRTVESCIGQRHVDLHIAVVDRNSPVTQLCHLRTALSGDPRVTYITKGYDPGPAAGRNIGARDGRGEVVLGLEAGALLTDPDGARRISDMFQAERGLGALSLRVLAGDGGPDPESWVSAHPAASMQGRPIPTISVCSAAHALRRSAFAAVGGFDGILFEGWEELDLCLRLIDAGWTVRYEPGPEVRRTTVDEGDGGPDALTRFARNRVYLARKYPGALGSPRAYAVACMVRALPKGLARPMLAAVRDGMNMPVARTVRLKASTLDYLDRHDGALPGSLLGRLMPAVTIHPAGARQHRGDSLADGAAARH